jgi:hypothetical protein
MCWSTRSALSFWPGWCLAPARGHGPPNEVVFAVSPLEEDARENLPRDPFVKRLNRHFTRLTVKEHRDHLGIAEDEVPWERIERAATDGASPPVGTLRCEPHGD